MKLLPKQKKKAKALPPAAAGKRKTNSRKGIPRFVFELPLEDREKLNEIAKWYSEKLKEKVSAAHLCRTALKQFIKQEAENIRKAAKGTLHAKPRKP